MAEKKPNEWVNSLLQRFDSQLPIRTGLHTTQSIKNMEQTKECLINVSKYKFSLVISELTRILQSVDHMQVYGPEAEKNFCDSLFIILDTLVKCLNSQPRDTSRLDEAILVKNVLQEIWRVRSLVINFMHMTVESGKLNDQLLLLTSHVLFSLSTKYFNTVFNRIVGSLDVAGIDESGNDPNELELIQFINVDVNRLTRIITEICNKFKTLKKNTIFSLATYLERAIWNWLETYPLEFDELHKRPRENLAECCDKLFELFYNTSVESTRRRTNLWPLQMMLLVLCPKILEEINNAENGAPISSQNQRKKQFMDEVKKALSSHSLNTSNAQKIHLTEAALLAAVNICKSASYININDRNNILFILVQRVHVDVSNLLFTSNKPCQRIAAQSSTDVVESLMTDFFVACFRITPHKKSLLKVCLQPNALIMYHSTLVNSLYRIITQIRLPWWPTIEILYSNSSEIREMFLETLNKVNNHPNIRITSNFTFRDKVIKLKDKGEESLSLKYNLLLNIVRLINADPILLLYCPPGKSGMDQQKSTFKLLNALVSLMQQPMTELGSESMEALLGLHKPEIIRLWNPESPVSAFWEISSQLLYSISQKLISRTMPSPCEVLKWLRKILVSRICYLQQHTDVVHLGGNPKMNHNALVKLETVFFVYLWSLEVDAVLTVMSCFQLLCDEAELWNCYDDMRVQDLMPLYEQYMEIARHSHTIITTGRAHLQKQIMALLRKVNHQTQGNKLAWEQTYNNWLRSTKYLECYPKYNKSSEESAIADLGSSVGIGPSTASNAINNVRSTTKRRPSHQSTDHELEDKINEWANMTGFLCSLGVVVLRPTVVVVPPGSGGNNTPALSTSHNTSDSAMGSGSTCGSTSIRSPVSSIGFPNPLRALGATNKGLSPTHSYSTLSCRSSQMQSTSTLDSTVDITSSGSRTTSHGTQPASLSASCQPHLQRSTSSTSGHSSPGPSSNVSQLTNPSATSVSQYPRSGAATVSNVPTVNRKGSLSQGMLHGVGSMPSTPPPSSTDGDYFAVTQFIGQLLSLLTCQHEKFGNHVQKHVKELLGHELNPLMYQILFDQLREKVDLCFFGSGQQQVQVTDMNTLFIENVIFIMRNILEKNTKTDKPSESLASISIEHLMLNIVRYVRHLECAHTIQVKIKVCHLVQKMMARRDDLTFRQEIRFRNKLVDYLCDWIMGSSHHLNLTSIPAALNVASAQANSNANIFGGPGNPFYLSGSNTNIGGAPLFQNIVPVISPGQVAHPNQPYHYHHHYVVYTNPGLIPSANTALVSGGNLTNVTTGNAPGNVNVTLNNFVTTVSSTNALAAMGGSPTTTNAIGQMWPQTTASASLPGNAHFGQHVHITNGNMTAASYPTFTTQQNVIPPGTMGTYMQGNPFQQHQNVDGSCFSDTNCGALVIGNNATLYPATGGPVSMGGMSNSPASISPQGSSIPPPVSSGVPLGNVYLLTGAGVGQGFPANAAIATPCVGACLGSGPALTAAAALVGTVNTPFPATGSVYGGSPGVMGTSSGAHGNVIASVVPQGVAYQTGIPGMASSGPQAISGAGTNLSECLLHANSGNSITRELDQACMEAVAALLEGLPLQPEESDRGDLLDAKSSMFAKYFTLFMNLLNDCGDDRNPRVEARRNMSALRNITVQAMSNLLSANIDSGLMRAIVLGYHRDPQTRAAFMEVLTKILQQGTEFETLAETALAERYEQLVGLVTMIGDKGELPIAMALAHVVPFDSMDELARVLVTLFDAKHLLYQLLWNMFSKEVEVADSIPTLFRGNSLATKIMTYCFKHFGQEYLQTLLIPAMKEMFQRDQTRGISYEVDPSRLECSRENMQENQKNLMLMTEMIFTRLMNSTECFPSRLRCVCHCLTKLISQRFQNCSSDQIVTVLSTVVFLRFVNPAVLSPVENGLLDCEPSPRMKRGLTLIGKIMQNIANQLLFTKEAHMRAFNDFLQKHFETCRSFFHAVSVGRTEAETVLLDDLVKILANGNENDHLPGVTSLPHVNENASSSVAIINKTTNNNTNSSVASCNSATGLTPATFVLNLDYPIISTYEANHYLNTYEDNKSKRSQLTKHSTMDEEEERQVSSLSCFHNMARVSGISADGMDAISSAQAVSIISDSVLKSLHRQLWYNQEKIGDYLSGSRDRKAVGRRPFDKMATLLAHLGPPEHKSIDSSWSSMDVSSNRLEDWVSKGHQFRDSEEFKQLKSSNVFYQAGHSRQGNPVFYFILRRYRPQEHQREDYPLIICLVSITLDMCRDRPFELVVDCTHSSKENRFKTELLMKWSTIIGPILRDYLVAAYIYNCNSWVREFTKYQDKIFLPIKGSRKLIFIDSLAKLNDYIEPDQQKLPGSTLALEEDLKLFTDALKLSHKDTKVSIKVGPNAIQVSSTEKTKVLGHSAILNDVYYASQLEEVCLVDDNQFTLTVGNDSGPLSFIHDSCDSIVQAIVHIRTRWALSQPDTGAVHTKLRPRDVPGTLLNIALLNLGSSDPSLRSAAYNLLCALTQTFDFKIEGQLLENNGLCIPANNTIFIAGISERLAQIEPHLTLEFLDECIQGFSKSSIEMKHLCLEYMTPWLGNLTRFCRVADEAKRQKVNLILDKLISMTIEEEEMYPSIQAKIWGNIGKVPQLLDMVLDSFFVRSVNCGLGSIPAEVMADTSVALAAANVSQVSKKVISRFCRCIEHTCSAPAILLENHSLWGDLAQLLRFLMMLSFNNGLDVCSHLPKLFHIATLMVSTGPLSLRASMHGFVINIVHSLCTSGLMKRLSEQTVQQLHQLLSEFTLNKFYTVFGIKNIKCAAVSAFRDSRRRYQTSHQGGMGNFGSNVSPGGIMAWGTAAGASSSGTGHTQLALSGTNCAGSGAVAGVAFSTAGTGLGGSTWQHAMTAPAQTGLQIALPLSGEGVFSASQGGATASYCGIAPSAGGFSSSATPMGVSFNFPGSAVASSFYHHHHHHALSSERFTLNSLEFLTDTLLEIMNLVIKDVPEYSQWLALWTDLARRFAFQHNPALQPRAIVVLGCISKRATDCDVKNLLRIMARAMENFATELAVDKETRTRLSESAIADLTLIEAVIMCLTRLVPLLRPKSELLLHLFWVALGILQLEEMSLYSAGLALLEQNLATTDQHGLYDHQSLAEVMMHCREPFVLQYKQLDHSVGMSFPDNFNFALVGHLLKGFRHPQQTVVSRTTRVLNMLLSITAKPRKLDKYEVTKENVAYLAALVPVSEDVRSRCHLRHRVPGRLGCCGLGSEPGHHGHHQPSSAKITSSLQMSPTRNSGAPILISETVSPDAISSVNDGLKKRMCNAPVAVGACSHQMLMKTNKTGITTNLSFLATKYGVSPPPPMGHQVRTGQAGSSPSISAGSLLAPQRSQSMETNQSQVRKTPVTAAISMTHATTDHLPKSAPPHCNTPTSESVESSTATSSLAPGSLQSSDIAGTHRGSVSHEDNVLLNPDVLNDEATQALTLTVLATLVRNTSDENEARVLYEYLADASVVFPKVFPVIHSLLDAKINYVLSRVHDQATLSAVQSIIQNTICSGEVAQQQLHYQQSIGFGGLWRFSGQFSRANQNREGAELFVNVLEIIIDSHNTTDEEPAIECNEPSNGCDDTSISSNCCISPIPHQHPHPPPRLHRHPQQSPQKRKNRKGFTRSFSQEDDPDFLEDEEDQEEEDDDEEIFDNENERDDEDSFLHENSATLNSLQHNAGESNHRGSMGTGSVVLTGMERGRTHLESWDSPVIGDMLYNTSMPHRHLRCTTDDNSVRLPSPFNTTSALPSGGLHLEDEEELGLDGRVDSELQTLSESQDGMLDDFLIEQEEEEEMQTRTPLNHPGARRLTYGDNEDEILASGRGFISRVRSNANSSTSKAPSDLTETEVD